MRTEVLDNGYVEFIETWGSDERIIEAARMSTAKGFQGWNLPCKKCDGTGAALAVHLIDGSAPCLACSGKGTSGDEKLLRYLYEHKHHTPFEMAGMTIEVQAPIFVMREWQRHRVPFGYNEMSARYTPLPDVNYVPTVERCLMPGGKNKQAQSTFDGLNAAQAAVWLLELQDAYEESQRVYQFGLDIGVPKEIARLCLPVGRYSRMRATGNLRGWLAFLTLRMDKNAQWEIRQYANVVGDIIAEKFPHTWELFNVTGPEIR